MSLAEKMLWVAARDLVIDDEQFLFILGALETDDLDELLLHDTGGAA